VAYGEEEKMIDIEIAEVIFCHTCRSDIRPRNRPYHKNLGHNVKEYETLNAEQTLRGLLDEARKDRVFISFPWKRL
jgi:hypothetical protein